MKTKLFARRAKRGLRVMCGLAVIWAALFAHTAFAQTPDDQKPAASQVQTLDGLGHLGTLSKALSSHSYAPVAALQRNLAAVGVSPGPVDGIYGPKTEQAVRTYQRQKGLTVDGKAGIETFSQLYYGGKQPVMGLQRDLQSQGIDPGAADGLYGPKTTQAVGIFQQKNGLQQDGVAGPITLGRLRFVTASGQPQAPAAPVSPLPSQGLAPPPSAGPVPKAPAKGDDPILLVAALAAAGFAVAIFAGGWVLFHRVEGHLEAETERAELDPSISLGSDESTEQRPRSPPPRRDAS